jgi:hypothetical protein
MRKIVFLLFLILFEPSVFAGEVISNVRGKVLVNTYGEKYKLNQKLYVFNPETQRKIGVIRVMQRRRDQEAIVAEMINGKAPPGALVEASERNISTEEEVDIRGHRTRARELDRRTKRDSAGTQKTKHGVSVSLINSQLAVKTAYVNTTMSGTGLAFDYSFQVPLFTQTSLLGGIGIHPIRISTSSSSGGSNTFSVTYYSLTGLMKYVFNPNQRGGWMGVGGGFIIPQSKTSNILEADSISTNYGIHLAVGNDIFSNKQLISLWFQYAIFPGANTSTTSTSFSQMIFGFSYFF